MKAGKNERTSARVARIAGRILESLAGIPAGEELYCGSKRGYFPIKADDLKALAASALTQAPDRKAKK